MIGLQLHFASEPKIAAVPEAIAVKTQQLAETREALNAPLNPSTGFTVDNLLVKQ